MKCDREACMTCGRGGHQVRMRWASCSGVTTVVAATAVLWGPAGLGGPGLTRINNEHIHSAAKN